MQHYQNHHAAPGFQVIIHHTLAVRHNMLLVDPLANGPVLWKQTNQRYEASGEEGRLGINKDSMTSLFKLTGCIFVRQCVQCAKYLSFCADNGKERHIQIQIQYLFIVSKELYNFIPVSRICFKAYQNLVGFSLT